MPLRSLHRSARARIIVSPLIALAFAGSLLVSRKAAAHDRSVVVSLEGGTCVAQSALRDAVTSRGGRIADEAPVHLRVKVDTKNDGQVGVEIGGRNARGPLAERRFVASSCADAVDALGLVIALAGDEAERVAKADDAPSSSASRADDAPSPAPNAPNAPTQLVAADAPAPSVPASKADTAPTPSRFALGAGAFGTSLGEGQVGARIAGTLEWKRSLVPWIEASASANVPRMIEGGGGGADPTWITGRLAAAPIGTDVGSRMRVSLFGAFEGGTLNVAGSGATRVDSKTRPWFAVAAGGRARWDLGDRFFAGLDVAGVVPLLRDDFVFLRGGTAYRVPVIAVESGIFLGAHFP